MMQNFRYSIDPFLGHQFLFTPPLANKMNSLYIAPHILSSMVHYYDLQVLLLLSDLNGDPGQLLKNSTDSLNVIVR